MEVKDPQLNPEKAKKDKYMKMGIIGFTLVVVIGAVLLMGQAEFFSGWFKTKPVTPQGNAVGVYKNNQTPPKPVSVIVSAVPTVVASGVPSKVGPSMVVSQVPSAVATPVASGVLLSPVAAAKVNIGSLQQLTVQMLKSMAKDDLVKNPGKYKLTNAQKKAMIDLYKKKHKK